MIALVLVEDVKLRQSGVRRQQSAAVHLAHRLKVNLKTPPVKTFASKLASPLLLSLQPALPLCFLQGCNLTLFLAVDS